MRLRRLGLFDSYGTVNETATRVLQGHDGVLVKRLSWHKVSGVCQVHYRHSVGRIFCLHWQTPPNQSSI